MTKNDLANSSAGSIKIEFDGKTISSLAELADEFELNKSTVRNRWNRGVRDLEKLTAQPKGRNFKARTILYNGHRYSSLKEFAEDNHLNPSTVRSRWSRGVRNPNDLARPAQSYEERSFALI